jgi:hypothetical protein
MSNKLIELAIASNSYSIHTNTYQYIINANIYIYYPEARSNHI